MTSILLGSTASRHQRAADEITTTLRQSRDVPADGRDFQSICLRALNAAGTKAITGFIALAESAQQAALAS